MTYYVTIRGEEVKLLFESTCRKVEHKTLKHFHGPEQLLPTFAQVDSQTVTLPFLKEPHLYVELKASTILLNTNIGLKVQGVGWGELWHAT